MVSERALASAHYFGSLLAACTEGALLVAHPERYEHWAQSLGTERARVQLVDWLSRAGKFFGDVDARAWEMSSNLVELEMPVRALLVEIVNWHGKSPVPSRVTAAAQGVVPLLGVAQRDPDGFAAYEAPTIPTPKRSSDALESLDDDLVDEGSEVRLLLEQLVETAHLDAALVSFRSGEVIAGVNRDDTKDSPDFTPFADLDTTQLVKDLLETSDLFFSLRTSTTCAAARLTGAHALLVGTSQTFRCLEHLREPGLGYTLDSLLQSFRSRLDRVSSTPFVLPDDDPPDHRR